jgi:hypothetical protein
MRSLPDLQRGLAQALIAHRAEPLDDCIIGARGLDSDAALAVYRNNVFGNYRNALRDDYPAILALVGEPFFHGACDAYVRNHASQSGDLNDFGSAFAQFIEDWPPASTLPYLGDIARLEWAIHLAFNAADAAPLRVESLAAVPPSSLAQLRMQLHPSAVLIESSYPIFAIWRLSTDASQTDTQVDLGAGGDRLLVVRRAGTVEIEPLTHAPFAALQALAAGATLAAAYADAVAIDAAFDLGLFLQRLVAAHSLVSFDVPYHPNQPGRPT